MTLTVVLSMAVTPAVAVGDDGGLLGGDDGDDVLNVSDGSGVSVGSDGVRVGGDSGVSAGTDGVSVGGRELDPSTADSGLADRGVAGVSDEAGVLGGDESTGDSDGTGVPVADDAPVADDGVSVPGRAADVGLPGDGSGPGMDAIPTGESVAGRDTQGRLPTGPLPVAVHYSVDSVRQAAVLAESTADAPGPDTQFVLGSGDAGSDGAYYFGRGEVADADRTYFDLDGDGTVSSAGVEGADGVIYTVNESGGRYILALSRDDVRTTGFGVAEGERVGLFNVRNTPGTEQGVLAAGLFPATVAGLGPEAPVGPEAPAELGGAVVCDGEECRYGVAGVNESLPSNRVTEPVKGSYPFPRSTDVSGTVLPCSRSVTADDLPAERLPGLSDLPSSGTGLPTSLLTNEAVLGLALGVLPEPCAVSDPPVAPVADPAVEPGSAPAAPTVDVSRNAPDLADGLQAFRRFEVGSGGDGPAARGFYVTTVTPAFQGGRQRLGAGDAEYEYFLVESRQTADGETGTGEFDTAVREDYAGVGGTLAGEPGAGNGTAAVRLRLVGRGAEFGVACTPGGCQPDYEGLPKLGSLPTVPNPLAGAGLPA